MNWNFFIKFFAISFSEWTIKSYNSITDVGIRIIIRGNPPRSIMSSLEFEPLAFFRKNKIERMLLVYILMFNIKPCFALRCIHFFIFHHMFPLLLENVKHLWYWKLPSMIEILLPLVFYLNCPYYNHLTDTSFRFMHFL